MAEANYPPFSGPLVRRWCDLMTEWDLRREHKSRLVRSRVSQELLKPAETAAGEAEEDLIQFEFECVNDLCFVFRLIEQRDPAKLVEILDKLGLITRREFEERVADLEDSIEFLLGVSSGKAAKEARRG